MIKSFRHKGLELFFHTASTRGIQAAHAAKLGRILRSLNIAKIPADMNLPGYKLHPLKGDFQKYWSVSVNGNWRVIFVFTTKCGKPHHSWCGWIARGPKDTICLHSFLYQLY